MPVCQVIDCSSQRTVRVVENGRTSRRTTRNILFVLLPTCKYRVFIYYTLLNIVLILQEKPFEELFCICSQLVTKTWKEMRATAEDFEKVFDVVREQILRALRKTPDSFDALRSIFNTLSYTEIMNIRQQERSSREEWELQAKPIQELKKKLEPEMIDLIKQNRINYLIAGTRFNKFTSRGLVSGRGLLKIYVIQQIVLINVLGYCFLYRT